MSKFCDACGLRLLGAALSSMCVAAPALGASLSLRSPDGMCLICTALTSTSHGPTIASYPDWIRLHRGWPALLDVGRLPSTQDGDSPRFESLTIRCWLRDEATLQVTPHEAEPSYSIDLPRSDNFWLATDPLTGLTAPNLPRDGSIVMLNLAPTGVATQPIRIANAWIRLSLVPSLHNTLVDYGLLHDLYPLTRD